VCENPKKKCEENRSKKTEIKRDISRQRAGGTSLAVTFLGGLILIHDVYNPFHRTLPVCLISKLARQIVYDGVIFVKSFMYPKTLSNENVYR